MRIVHIEDFFHPEAGYQVNILAKYMAAEGHDVYVLTSEMEAMPEYLTDFFGRKDIELKDKEYFEKTGVKIIRQPVWKFVSGRSIYKKEIFRMVEALNPEILYVHGNDTLIGIQYTLKSARLKFPILIDSHMLEMASANKFNKLFHFLYRKIVAPIIINNNLVVIRTQNDNYVERCLGIPLANCPWISTGTDTMLFKHDLERKKCLREVFGINQDCFVVIYAGKIDDAKGGKFLAEALRDKIEDLHGNPITTVIVGNTNGEYGQEVESILLESQNSIKRFPTQPYAKLVDFYQIADIAVYPKQCSLSFYDVQACGLPVVMENNNINCERVSFKNGMTFESESIYEFRKKIQLFSQMPTDTIASYKDNAIDYVKQKYDYKDITKQYLDVIESVIEGHGK